MTNEDSRLWYCSKCDMFHTSREECPKTGESYNKKERRNEKRIEAKILEERLKRKQEILNKKEKLLEEWKGRLKKENRLRT